MTNKEETTQQPQQIKKIPIMAVLLIGAFVAILNQTLLATALPPIMEDLNISANTAQWLTSIFMLVNGIMIPITAFLIETFTTRKLFLMAISTFTIGTLLCAVAPNFPVLMVGRIIQASGAGVMMPLMQTVILLIFPIEKRGSAMGFIGLVIAFAPSIGPTLSGFMVDHFHWRTLFYIVLPIAAVDIIVAYYVLKNVTEQRFPKVDIPSIILSTLGFGGILYGFSTAGNSGWGSWPVIITMSVGIITLFFFSIRQLRLTQPILELRVLKYGLFTLSTAIGMLVFIAMIGAATVLPIYMQDMRNFTAMESGLMMLPGAALMGLMSPITGKIFDKFGARTLAIIGILLMSVSNFMYTDLTTTTSFTYMTVMYLLRMIGIAMVMMPVTTAGLNVLPKHLIPHGTAVNNTLRQVAGSIGTALLVTVMTTTAMGKSPSMDTEALIHGVNMAFWVAFVFGVIGLVLSFFLKKT
ncbi:drug resistance transporter, EmrB/QacA subfamily [Alteribacillus persepolensis]|uniref:Drug resistance transporter, EmrB/QacA subfamily n=1 Tax=Alteribacillus persepolensis TaxID=568899 RepID=A0A1G7Z7F2_9BACI|nr:MDR family MFS transporter [Alteribacillus persepolensis]SDH04436.1 drug resistance transporter, EmrB/QacA subfamily [Alteribacillus persepolensis]